MNVGTHSTRRWPSYKPLAISCIAHAAAVLVLGLGAYLEKWSFVDGKAWALLGWAWLLWPVVLSFHPRRTKKQLYLPLLAGAVLLVPCVPFLLALSAWAVGGFGP
jgi:hypothetical protein